jgi:protein TonB
MAVEITGTGFAIAVGVMLFVILGIIFGYRALLRKRAESDLSKKHREAGDDKTLASRVKYPEVNPFNVSGPVFLFGLATALLLSLLALSWTQYEKPVYIPDDAMLLDEEIEIEPPRTAEPPPPPPPPPPPVIEEVPEEEIIEEEEPEFMDMSIEEETQVVEPEPVIEAPPPPPPPPEPEVEEIFKVVEQMPRFPGCEDISGSEAEKKQCAQQKLLEYVYKNIKYPAIARENGIQGQVVIQFVVEKDGSVTDARILRDIGAGCGQEALRVVEAMNNLPQGWTPGKQRGKAVRVMFTLPVKFKLE